MMQIMTDSACNLAAADPGSTDISPADTGIAVDVGTTTVVVCSYSRRTGRRLATAAAQNAQVVFGHDVIERIAYAVRGGDAAFLAVHQSIIELLEKLFSSVLFETAAQLPRGQRPVVSAVVITGNTTMLSFVSGTPVDGLAAVPFTPGSYFGSETDWGAVRNAGQQNGHRRAYSSLEDTVPVYFPPCPGAFIGADTVCAMVASGFPVPGRSGSDQSLLLADVGTNCELALSIPPADGKKGRIVCTAAAAGPAFEAANISCGMSALSGAIDQVSRSADAFICHVIDGGPAQGICGSGLLSAVAAALSCGSIDKTGAIADGERSIRLTDTVRITQQDVRNLQLAKTAVAVGTQYLLEKAPRQLPRLILAGGFGTLLNKDDAAAIGLFPRDLLTDALQVGNASLAGAAAMLFSDSLRTDAQELSRQSFQINLAALPGFQERFIHGLDF